MSTRPTALVTGASRGIGLAIVHELSTTHHVHLGGRDQRLLEKLATELPSAEPWVAELRDEAATAAAAQQIADLDLLVHSAGVLRMGTVAEASTNLWRESFEVNVFAVAALTRLMLPALRARKGQVIAINSGSGYHSGSGSAIYSGTKFALRALTDALREEERIHGVRVSSIHPGRVATDMQRELHEWEGSDYSPEAWIQPVEIARAVRLAVDTPRGAAVENISIRPSGIH